MAATGQNFTIYQGDDNVPIQFTIVDDAGVVLDVSTAQFTWALAKKLRGVPLVTKTLADDVNLSDPTNGVIQIVFRAADTENIHGEYQHELVMVLDGETLTVAVGTVTIEYSTIK